MSLVETIKLWDEGVAAADMKDWGKALASFSAIQEPNSKIFFNMGCLYLILGKLDQAEWVFDNSIAKDEHLAVAFFQRGITFYKMEKYEEALRDFEESFNQLRGNQLIDYKILGLRYKLYACEVLYNGALAHAQLKNWRRAEENLVKAQQLKMEPRHSNVDHALEAVKKEKVFKAVELPPGNIFRPKQQHVAQLEKKDYLGKAKIKEAAPQIKAPEKLQALEGIPHQVLYEFVPETSKELTLMPGNIVFLLEKGKDNWATVVFNGKQGLVPYNYLESIGLKKSSDHLQEEKDENIPPLPSLPPPERPSHLYLQDRKFAGLEVAEQDQEEKIKNRSKSTPLWYIVKVHFSYTIVVRVKPGLGYDDLMEVVCKKLQQPKEKISLSYRQKESGELFPVTEADMKSMWNQAKNGCLTVWCSTVEDREHCSPDLTEGEDKENSPGQKSDTYVTAIFNYQSTAPEDLEFQEGDLITVLSKVNEDWLEGQCNGRVGVFPASFVKEYAQQG
nr:PREDICTED: neutrophil cytosol factor 2 isoform X2 [Latimeria chalumnae]|eukprot:XP_006005525.1 PREDICTED: neutrophil cytosol factor 2 isoform X2 [Latimeria chalumnae]